MQNKQIENLEQKLIEVRKELAAARRAYFACTVDAEYTFRTADGAPVTLRELFGDKRDLLVVHNMGRRCSYCSLWADGFMGLTPHLESRCAFVLASPDDPHILKEFAASRPAGTGFGGGWNFRCVSIAGTSFARDLKFEPEPGQQWPGVSAFRLDDDGTIRRITAAMFGPGDDFCSLWHLLDLLEGGPAGESGWDVQFSYAAAGRS